MYTQRNKDIHTQLFKSITTATSKVIIKKYILTKYFEILHEYLKYNN